MRTTITFERDVAAAVERLRRERSIGPSEAVNELIREGLRSKGSKRSKREFHQRSQVVGLRIDVTNVADALEQLDGTSSR